MGSSCRPQSELRPAFWDSLHLAVSQPFVPAIVACVKPRHKGHDDLTSSPPSSELTPAVSYESPPLRAGNIERGLRSLRDLTQHLTTRADDNHAPPVYRPCGEHISALFRHMSRLGKVLPLVSYSAACSAISASPRQFLPVFFLRPSGIG